MNERHFKLGFFGGLMMATQMVCAASADPAIDGTWGGDRLQLTIDAKGGRLESDCASGGFAGPLVLGKDGRFVASGHFTQHQAGPDRADADTAATQASYVGEVKPDGSSMTLSIKSAGAEPAQVFTLRKGVKVKLVRCL
ncbi:hypothetical protein [Roseateles oligotrophus]|uniref:Uncharacterized protein n=1 Tax=Roseateles oligotrophus TaxID=1769250 RepID=A0ABT2YKG6_9BURK|nr:hypothetical protein [Roseateles oligotrophus]MCV2370552.1 hypothetical protein [Roseateles oligotrophus]